MREGDKCFTTLDAEDITEEDRDEVNCYCFIMIIIIMAAWQEILSSVFISYSVAPLETISQGAQFADMLLDLNTNT